MLANMKVVGKFCNGKKKERNEKSAQIVHVPLSDKRKAV